MHAHTATRMQTDTPHTHTRPIHSQLTCTHARTLTHSHLHSVTSRTRERNVLTQRLGAIIAAVDRVGGRQDGRARVQRCHKPGLGDRDGLLLHGLHACMPDQARARDEEALARKGRRAREREREQRWSQREGGRESYSQGPNAVVVQHVDTSTYGESPRVELPAPRTEASHHGTWHAAQGRSVTETQATRTHPHPHRHARARAYTRTDANTYTHTPRG
jgi:hypothetical protein